MEVDLDGMKTYVDFNLINILHDKDPYRALLGINFSFDNDDILNLKWREILFEK